MTRKQWIATAAVLCVALWGGVAAAQQPRGTTTTAPMGQPLSNADRQFILAAIAGSDREVQLGELAKEMGQSQAVKELGARLVQDHTKAALELRRLAASHAVSVAQAPTTTGAQNQSLEYLAKVPRAVFDKEFLDAMAKDHEKDVAEFEQMSKQAQDADLKAWVARTLPTIQDHLRAVKSIQTAMPMPSPPAGTTTRPTTKQ